MTAALKKRFQDKNNKYTEFGNVIVGALVIVASIIALFAFAYYRQQNSMLDVNRYDSVVTEDTNEADISDDSLETLEEDLDADLVDLEADLDTNIDLDLDVVLDEATLTVY